MADSLDGHFFHPTTQSSSTQPLHTSMDHDTAATHTGHIDPDSNYVPRPKRIACVVCRRRKLRCDGRKPSCGTCSRLGHECAYDEVRKKSGPKRGYVKQLEARLAQVETLLKTQEVNPSNSQGNGINVAAPQEFVSIPETVTFTNSIDAPMSSPEGEINNIQSSQTFLTPGLDRTGNFGWDMISLGLEEPLPDREIIDELNQIYFEKIHPYMPILHRPRHLAAMDLAPSVRPPVCLQYITWCQAASVSEKYSNLHALFYQRARKYAELDEMKGLGENILSLPYCQTWLLIGTYEFRMMFFPRAWLSVGKAARLALMLGLNRLDGMGLEVKQSLPPARDWTEKEERRRVFWMAFCIDRFASVGTGWPVLIDERDVKTNLPATEEAFVKSKPQRTLRVEDILAGDGLSTLSSFGSVSFMAYMFGRNLSHLHRPDPQDNDHDLNGLYWQRHRSHDNVLLHFALAMPNHLRLPAGMSDPNVIFCNMAIHTSTICLHQAAIFKAEKNRMPEQIITESKRRCIVAADQISNIMKMISHMDLTALNPFMSYSVYVAARVFVQYLKSRPDDSAARSSLGFVFTALDAMKNKNPLTESFLVQLDVDIEGTPFRDIRQAKRPRITNNVKKKGRGCTPLVPVEQHQNHQSAIEEVPARPSAGPQQHYYTPSSLASREGQSLPQLQNRNPPGSDPFAKSPFNLSSGTESGTGTDKGLSPEFTDKSSNNSPVSNDTSILNPTTIHDPSSTTYLPLDPSSSLKQQQQPSTSSSLNQTNHQQSHTSLDPSSAVNMSMGAGPFGAFDMGFSSQLYQTGMVTPLDSTGSEGSIPMPTWDFGAPQTSNGENVDMITTGIESLEAQWAQLLGSAPGTGTGTGTGWDSWRNQV
ncbi:fungal transcription factor regulatory middle homology region [Aspergillus parasiticus SU-1]|uniref:Fungal-specific transcription factor domain-containing protein n=3 Tax=Aspergillus subgen. Circumdati TaxID=2720871 RepID=A0A5N6D8P8_ASPPA|nr:fungal-specific transcription factor domain-containing protein [Aspergillus parasiticus]KAE8318966.1 fungal-specific transcription factor domain-containing protein [Aspergillus transmontanensis]KJK65192.1 fungal transcription factor regulatory middle homology region [Aspergillus parasiticus SU-1]